MNSRIVEIRFKAITGNVWDTLTRLKLIDEYEMEHRRWAVAWANNVGTYTGNTITWESNDDILKLVDRLRRNKAYRPAVSTFLHTTDGVVFGVSLRCYEEGMEVQVVRSKADDVPYMKLTFPAGADVQLLARLEQEFAIMLPQPTNKRPIREQLRTDNFGIIEVQSN